jgi:hypothetical protein
VGEPGGQNTPAHQLGTNVADDGFDFGQLGHDEN